MNHLIKILCLSVLICFAGAKAWAKHVKGGEIHYEYVGPGALPNTDRYRITLRLFIACNSTQGQLETSVNLGIYNNDDNSEISRSPLTMNLSPATSRIISLTKPSPCILNPSAVCYWIREFIDSIDLPRTAKGYTVIFQRCCRIDHISNVSPAINVGASYTCQIQGTNSIGFAAHNSNPQFDIKDTVLICQKHRFTLNYGATDKDGDSLSYQFITGYYGGSADEPIVDNPASPQYLQPLDYKTGFSGLQPLGANVSIDNRTGVISGVAPAAGDYVVCVQLTEWRNGIIVTRHSKDFIVHIDDKCDFPSAALEPTYITCDGFNYSFQNEAASTPLIHSYFWDFGVKGLTTDTSYAARASYNFPDTGTFTVTLYINKGEDCSDSTTTQMKVYPGFFPGFIAAVSCLLHPVQFRDSTKTRYGIVSSWNWNFGDARSSADTSSFKNPSWQYADTGIKKVQFIVANSKGCLDTVNRDIYILDKPPINLPFRDTLICSIDTLQLVADGVGNFSWTPVANMLRSNTPNPLVYPKTTTTYTVSLDDNGCSNTDSLKVRVVDEVTLYAGNDTTVCLGDTIRFNPAGNALYFKWSPSASVIDPSQKYAEAVPNSITSYSVVASIGKCSSSGSFTIKPVPYPLSKAGNDTMLCYADTALLYATVKGIRLNWTPAATLSDPLISNPLAFPLETTTYSLFVYDTLGCPKPGISTTTVTVDPQILAFAGNDTSIVIGQPLQLTASGAPAFLWFPAAGLNRSDIYNPVATIDKNAQYIIKAYRENGCFAMDTINIKVFTTAPEIFVPNAFTPGKSVNAVFRPIPVGISSIEFFRIYNRDGMLIYNTNRIGNGWDGTRNGKAQDSGGYVWTVKGTDYTGKVIIKKGTMVLIR